jgi:hypothetical protein
MTDTPTSVPAEALSYTYKPSLVGAPWTFRLSDAGLVYEAGRGSGLVPYRHIRRVRLSFKPVSMQTQRFMTEIWADGAPKFSIVSSSWKSLLEQERLDVPYAAFIAELHRRLAHVGSDAQFEQGTHPLLYWPGVVIFTSVSLGLSWLVVRALQTGSLGGAAFIGLFLAVFFWHGINFLRRNRPGRYRADALPPDLTPRG